MDDRKRHQLGEFASLFLSTDPIDWNNPSNHARVGSLLPITLADNHVLCSVASFSLEKRKHHSGTPSRASVAEDVATSLDDELKFSLSTMPSLTPTITSNIVQSFMALVNSRVKSTVQALWKHAQQDSSQRLLQILNVLSTMSESLVSPTKVTSRTRVGESGTNVTGEGATAPVQMVTFVEVDVLGEQHSIVLEASGTMSASFEPSSSKIVHTKISFNTTSFLETLMVNARDSVKYATKRLFELYLTSPNLQVAQGLDPQLMNQQRRYGTYDDEKESDSPRLSPTMGTCNSHGLQPSEGGIQYKLQSGYLNGKSFSGVDLLKMAAESLT